MIARTKVILRVRMALFRRFTEPFHRLGKIFFHTLTIVIAKTEIILRVYVPLFRRFTEPFHRLGKIFFYTLTIFIAHTELILPLGIPGICGFPPLCYCFGIPLVCFRLVFFHAPAVCVAVAQIALRFRISLFCGLAV